ncbi:MAG: hypothetical protein A2086_05780 [Spirochaetes bacterium GWD1_27_9]|nr:MAG: hypothetical protein A2Y34_15095 [Spirochaetes bacterium GWC1_27_15]OHD35287.1 MAG: hypothetical protein A2086_05780 [Spirochaetes bacterium GWD1_27_9]
MSKKILSFIVLLSFFMFIFLVGCPTADTASTTTTISSALLKLSLTDAPAADFKKVEVNFDKVEVAMSGESNAEWITINQDAGIIDLLALNNGKLQELGVKDLSAGQYNQIRIAVSSVSITLKDDTVIDSSKIHLASNTIKLVKPFTLTNGITTELIVDFDANHSIIKTGSTPSQYSYTITPVTRLAFVNTTGAFKGSVTPIVGKTITVTAYQDGLSIPYAGTICDASGDWMIGYLEAGTYDLKVETTDATVDIQDKLINVGEITTISNVTIQ